MNPLKERQLWLKKPRKERRKDAKEAWKKDKKPMSWVEYWRLNK